MAKKLSKNQIRAIETAWGRGFLDFGDVGISENPYDTSYGDREMHLAWIDGWYRASARHSNGGDVRGFCLNDIIGSDG
jgi:hypothetical protein